MAGKLKVNQNEVEAGASLVVSAAQLFMKKSLSIQDEVSTINANQQSKDEFEKVQNQMSRLGESLNEDAVNTRNLGLKFKEFDSLMGEMNSRNVEAANKVIETERIQNVGRNIAR